MVRGVRRARREVHEEGLVRRQRLLELHPGDRLVRHVGHEVVVRVPRDLDRVHAVVEVRRPLVGLAAEEAVELVEPGPRRPAVGRTGGADLPGRRLVVLAEEAGAVAVEAQHLGERRHVVRALPRVARERRGRLGDPAHVVHVVVAAAEQRRPRRRADRRRVELVVAQPRLRQAVGGRHVDRPAERARHAEAHVVDRARSARSAPPRAPSPRSAAAAWPCGRRARSRADSSAPGSAAPCGRAPQGAAADCRAGGLGAVQPAMRSTAPAPATANPVLLHACSCRVRRGPAGAPPPGDICTIGARLPRGPWPPIVTGIPCGTERVRSSAATLVAKGGFERRTNCRPGVDMSSFARREDPRRP